MIPDQLAAGTFVAQSPEYLETSYSDSVSVSAYGSAIYLGPLDSNDNSWLIQTFINDSWGNDLEDWRNPDFWGAGANGGGIYSGQVIYCLYGCAARGSIPRPQILNLPVYYWGRNATAIYHQYSPEISDALGPWVQVQKKERPDACPTGIVGEVKVMGLGKDRGPSVEPRAQPLVRSDEVAGVSYLLEEWVLFEQGPKGASILAVSSNQIRDSLAGPAAELLPPVTESREVLVVQYPLHPHNARHIELPEMVLARRTFTGGISSQTWFRADFAPEGGRPRLEILSPEGGDTAALELYLAESLQLRFKTEKRHRVIAFLQVEVDAQGFAHLRESLVYLAECCCEEWPACPV